MPGAKFEHPLYPHGPHPSIPLAHGLGNSVWKGGGMILATIAALSMALLLAILSSAARSAPKPQRSPFKLKQQTT